MQSDLLKKEDEFYKENEKLEQRTKELMKKVNDVMVKIDSYRKHQKFIKFLTFQKIQDNLIKETLKTSTEFNKVKINNFDLKSNSLHQCFVLTEDTKNEDLNIPSSVNEMGKKGVIHFYRAKIKSLQDQNSSLHTENRKKVIHIMQL